MDHGIEEKKDQIALYEYGEIHDSLYTSFFLF
jgi:hypothetical protein